MSTRRRSRNARRQAAVALLAYVEERTPDTERALLGAAHELEALAAWRSLQRAWHRGPAARLAHPVTAR